MFESEDDRDQENDIRTVAKIAAEEFALALVRHNTEAHTVSATARNEAHLAEMQIEIVAMVVQHATCGQHDKCKLVATVAKTVLRLDGSLKNVRSNFSESLFAIRIHHLRVVREAISRAQLSATPESQIWKAAHDASTAFMTGVYALYPEVA